MAYQITNQNNFSNIAYPCASYPNATVKTGGCGACSILNCVENTSSLRFTMQNWINYVIANGGRINGGTSIPTVLKALALDYSFSYQGTNDLSTIKKHLKNGGMAVFHAGGAYSGWKGLLSSSGHYVCLAGMSGSNAIVIDSGWYKGKYSGTWRKSRIVKDYQNSVITISFDNLEKDKKYRSNGGTNYYLITAPTAVSANNDEEDEIVYKTLAEVPEYYKEAVQKRVNLGVYNGENTTESMARAWTVDDRMLEKENPMYQSLADVPEYWRADVKFLIDNGVIKGDGKYQIGMRKNDLRNAVISKRLCNLK